MTTCEMSHRHKMFNIYSLIFHHKKYLNVGKTFKRKHSVHAVLKFESTKLTLTISVCILSIINIFWSISVFGKRTSLRTVVTIRRTEIHQNFDPF